MWFLSVGPRICLQLPSDFTSRWTPLLFSYALPVTWACLGLSPIRARPWRANQKKSYQSDNSPHTKILFKRRFLCTTNYSWHQACAYVLQIRQVSRLIDHRIRHLPGFPVIYRRSSLITVTSSYRTCTCFPFHQNQLLWVFWHLIQIFNSVI